MSIGKFSGSNHLYIRRPCFYESALGNLVLAVFISRLLVTSYNRSMVYKAAGLIHFLVGTQPRPNLKEQKGANDVQENLAECLYIYPKLHESHISI